MKMSVKRSLVLASAVAAFGSAGVANATLTFDVQALSVSGPGVTLTDAHDVAVTATGGTVNFGVYADVTNSTGTPAANDGFQTARLYGIAGLASGAGAVAGNDGPLGNMTNGLILSPFNGNSSVGPSPEPTNTGTTTFTSGETDLNGNTFTDYGNLTTDAALSVIPRSPSQTTNSANGTNGSNFLFMTFSIPITSLGAGTTNVTFINTGTSISVGWEEAGATKSAANGTIGTSISTVLTSPGAVVGSTSLGLGPTATNTLTSPSSVTITPTPSGYAGTPVVLSPAVATGSIGLNNIGAGQVEVLIHSSKTLPNLTSANFNGGTAIDLTGGGLDADAANLLSFYPWANILIRYPSTTDANNAFFNFDLSGSGATVSEIVAVPEPASLGLLTMGTLALLARRRKAAK